MRLHSKNPDGREVLEELRKEVRGGEGISGYLDNKIAQAGKSYSVSKLLVAMSMVGFMIFLFLAIVLPVPPLFSLIFGALSGVGLPMLYL